MQLGAGFEQVRGETMAEDGGIDRFLNPGAAGGLDAGMVGRFVIDGVIAAVPGIAGK